MKKIFGFLYIKILYLDLIKIQSWTKYCGKNIYFYSNIDIRAGKLIFLTIKRLIFAIVFVRAGWSNNCIIYGFLFN